MITALCDFFTPPAASARKICGSESPPSASPPMRKKSRRETPSQNRPFECPLMVSMGGEKGAGAGCMGIPAHTEKLRLLFPGKLLEPSGVGEQQTTMPSHKIMCSERERHVSGRVGVPPAVLRVPRNTRRMSTGFQFAIGERMYSAGREIRQAGRPPYPMHAALLARARCETNAYFPAAFAFAASIFALIFAGSSGFSFSARSQYWIASA